jgi:hypothetical protein
MSTRIRCLPTDICITIRTLKDTWDLGASGLSGHAKNIQNWLELDEGTPGLQLLTEEEIVTVIFFSDIYQHYLYFVYFPFICLLLFCLLGLSFASFIRIIS